MPLKLIGLEMPQVVAASGEAARVPSVSEVALAVDKYQYDPAYAPCREQAAISGLI